MYSYTYETRYGDYKTRDTIKPAAVLDIVQDISIKNSEFCGYGIHKLKSMNIAWLMQGIKLHFEKPVATLTPITVYTAVKNMSGVVSERGCIIKQNDITVAKTVAAWFIVDTVRMRPIRIPLEISQSYETHDFEDDFFSYKKPQLLEAEKAYTVKIFSKEIDTNNHLNNQKSAELLIDALPYDFTFTDMNVLYKKEAHISDELEVCIKKIENGYYVHLQTMKKEICVAGIFENKQ